MTNEEDLTVVANAAFDASSDPATEKSAEGNPEIVAEGDKVDTAALLLGFLNSQSDQPAPQSPGVQASPPTNLVCEMHSKMGADRCNCASTPTTTVKDGSYPYWPPNIGEVQVTIAGPTQLVCEMHKKMGADRCNCHSNQINREHEKPKPGPLCAVYLAAFIIVLMLSGFLVYWFL